MDVDFAFASQLNEEKPLKDEVSKVFGVYPVFKVHRILKVDEFQPDESYVCRINVGNSSYDCRIDEQLKVHQREDKAIRTATNYLFTKIITKQKHNTITANRAKFKVKKVSSAMENFLLKNSHKIPNVKKSTEDGWPSLTNFGTNEFDAMYKCVKYISDEVLAMQFKDIVWYIVKKYSTATPQYATKLYQDGNFPGYMSILEFKGRKFESLGLMADEYQAEQSAAEVCLRTLRFIPNVSTDNFVIQPYQGGLSRNIEGVTVDNQCVFINTVFFDVLTAFLVSRNMLKPKFYSKMLEFKSSRLSANEFDVCGVPEQKVHGLLRLSGKLFHSPSPEIGRVCMQLAANEALKYFGVSHPVERMELRKHIRINRQDFWNPWNFIWKCRPSQFQAWKMDKFCCIDTYGDTGVDDLLNSEIIMNNFPDKEYMHELVRKEMGRNPAFRGKDLTEIEDLSVAAVDSWNPNLFTVGNSQFSIKVLIDGGKLYSQNRKTMIDVLPGYNIQKLKCEYRVSLPSLEIHLKAIDCQDLYLINPPLPVVTSCGVVVLYHDQEACPESLYVLLKRRDCGTSFESKVHLLKLLLHSLIMPTNGIPITAADCTKDIGSWFHKEVKLLSEMTMDSLQELMSAYIEYDIRWNEILAKSELDTSLKEIQVVCMNELKRRKENGISDQDLNKMMPWELPHSKYVTRFDEIGVHLEDSMFCVMRALVSSTGIMMNTSVIEACTTVDISIEDGELCKGELSRFYIWPSRNEGTPTNDVTDQEILVGYKLTNIPIDHQRRRIQYSNKAGIFHSKFDITEQSRILQNIEYVNVDGSRTKYVDYKKMQTNSLVNAKLNPLMYSVVGNDAKYECNVDRSVNDSCDQNLIQIPMPGDIEFKSFKDSLMLYCSAKHISKPRYRHEKLHRRRWFLGLVDCDNITFTAGKPGRGRNKAETLAACEALYHFGYLKEAQYDIYFRHHLSKRTPIDRGLDTFICSVKENGNVMQKGKNDFDIGDSGVGCCIREAEENIYSVGDVTSALLDGNCDSTNLANIISVKKDLPVTSSDVSFGEEEVDEATVSDDVVRDMITSKTEDILKNSKLNEETIDDNTKRTESAEGYDRVDELNSCASDKCDENVEEAPIEVCDDALSDSCMKQSESGCATRRPVIYEWVNDEDIKLDELDNPNMEDVIRKTGEKRKEKYRKKRWRRQKKLKRDGYVKTEHEWGKEEDVVGFERDSGKEDESYYEKRCIPDLSWVYFDAPKRSRPWKKKYKHPILPPRDAYREECMWMKLDEAMAVCPVLVKITQTTEFQEQLHNLVRESNEFMKDKNIAGTVKTYLT